MLKRQKADPRQLCFVFENVGGTRGDPAGTVRESSSSGCGEVDGRGELLKRSGALFFREEVESADARPKTLPSGTPPAVVAAHASKHILSGPDPGLTALCGGWLEGLGAESLAKKMTVVWNRRFTSAAGVARYGPNRIELNPALVRFEGEIERTLRHEVAHLLARFRNPTKKIQPHGAEWRRACADLGIPGEPIYHTLPFQSRRRKRNYAYRCTSCTQVITRVRPLKGYCACYTCCKSFNRGRYDSKYRLEKVPMPKEEDNVLTKH